MVVAPLPGGPTSSGWTGFKELWSCVSLWIEATFIHDMLLCWVLEQRRLHTELRWWSFTCWIFWKVFISGNLISVETLQMLATQKCCTLSLYLRCALNPPCPNGQSSLSGQNHWALSFHPVGTLLLLPTWPNLLTPRSWAPELFMAGELSFVLVQASCNLQYKGKRKAFSAQKPSFLAV